jgi:hypothetical protein
MARARIGTGELTPFKKSSPGSTTVESSKTKNGPTRSGFYDNVSINHTGGPQSQTNPTVGRMGWRQKQSYQNDTSSGKVPEFQKREGNGIKTFPAFSKKEVGS